MKRAHFYPAKKQGKIIILLLSVAVCFSTPFAKPHFFFLSFISFSLSSDASPATRRARRLRPRLPQAALPAGGRGGQQGVCVREREAGENKSANFSSPPRLCLSSSRASSSSVLTPPFFFFSLALRSFSGLGPTRLPFPVPPLPLLRLRDRRRGPARGPPWEGARRGGGGRGRGGAGARAPGVDGASFFVFFFFFAFRVRRGGPRARALLSPKSSDAKRDGQYRSKL